MQDLKSLQTFLNYSDWANQQLLTASEGLLDAQLDAAFDMGRGSLRKTLIHLWAGEQTWLQRWQGRAETPWPDEEAALGIREIAERFSRTVSERASFVATLQPEDFSREIRYRDSKGSRFDTTLADMLTQGVVHSIHHRAQAVNMLRQVAAVFVDLDYMYRARKPVNPETPSRS